MLDISRFSRRYGVRRMGDDDADAILGLCVQNTQYYEYCAARPSREQVLGDLRLAPPGVDLSRKYYVGFYDGPALVAVLDLIDGYPEADIAYIGFFMMNRALQKRGVGSGIIEEVCRYLKETGFSAARLGIDKGNPQSTHFWKKNGFVVLYEVDRGDWTALVAEKRL